MKQLVDGFHVEDRRNSKQVLDNVHGNIYLEPLMLEFVDTEQFQRLRDIKQLGLTNLIYPGAVHSRFEHSLGVHWLAGEAIRKIIALQGSEFDIDAIDVNAVKLAGLLHDVGHGPFSHMFETLFVPKAASGTKWTHEEMAVKMIDYIVDEHHIDIDSDCLKKTKDLITASADRPCGTTVCDKRFLYDIVANGRNGVDVDKFDYLARDSLACGLSCGFQHQRLMDTMRVMGDEICYRAKDYLTVHKLFATRADMHRTVYMHAKGKAIDHMVTDALTAANEYYQITSALEDPARFWKLDDSILKAIEISDAPELKEARDLIRRIRTRDLYQFCNEFSVPKEALEHFKPTTAQDIVCSQTSGGITLKEDDIVVSNIKIDLTRGRDNPLGSVNFFTDWDSNEKFKIPDDRVSHLLPSFCQDKIVRVYSKNPNLTEAVSEAFENFQLKTYNLKAQVYDTTRKRRYRRPVS